MTDRVDIAIVGAGPAGSAAALALRAHAPGLTVRLLDAGDAPRFRPGEVLPAAGAEMLRQLGVAAAVAPAAVPAPGLALLWGSDRVAERNALFAAQGGDWHLDRNRFDQLLAHAAAERGAKLDQKARVTDAQPLPGGGWRLSIAHRPPLDASFTIWATGRRRGFLGAVRAKPQVSDRLAAHLAFYREETPGDRRFLLEATPEGWWYAAATPGGGRTIGFLTDADLLRQSFRDSPDWAARLGKTALIAAGLGQGATLIGTHTCSASSSVISPLTGPDWIAAGDAACTFEPLSSQGIAKALRSGCFAAYAALDCLDSKADTARARYEALVQGEFSHYRATLAQHYRAETRWPTAVFWHRRLAPSAFPADMRTAQPHLTLEGAR